mgnify:CR=1 FL=1
MKIKRNELVEEVKIQKKELVKDVKVKSKKNEINDCVDKISSFRNRYMWDTY